MPGQIRDKGSNLENYPAGTKDLKGFSGMRREPCTFVRVDVAASLTDSPLNIGGATAVVSYLFKRAGSLTGLGAVLSAAAAGDALLIEVRKNGVKTGMPSLTLAVAATEGSATYDKDAHAFAAGDNLDIVITTPAGWTSTTVDLAVFPEIED